MARGAGAGTAGTARAAGGIQRQHPGIAAAATGATGAGVRPTGPA